MPVAFVGSLESVATEPYENVHGKEWAVTVRVRQILLGSWPEDTLEFGVTSPTTFGLKKDTDYYFVAMHGHHGMVIIEQIPVTTEPTARDIRRDPKGTAAN